MNQILNKVIVSFLVGMMALPAMAEKRLGIFNSVSVGAGVSTTGIDVTLAAPITSHFVVRGGVSFFPDFTFTTGVDANATVQGVNRNYFVDLKGGLKRTSGNFLLNYYPSEKYTFFLSAGAYFGGSSLVAMTGHSDEIAADLAEAGNAGITIGDQLIPVDKDGNVAGGLKVAGFRPYVGLGVGRAVPKKRVGVLFEMGVQFHGTPEVYTDKGTLSVSSLMNNDDTFSEIIDKLTVYPVVKLHVFFRTF